MSAVHATFVLGSKWSGRPVAVDVPDRLRPRNSGQSCGSAAGKGSMRMAEHRKSRPNLIDIINSKTMLSDHTEQAVFKEKSTALGFDTLRTPSAVPAR